MMIMASGAETAIKNVSKLLRVGSVVSLVLALASAIIVVALRIIHCFEPALFPWPLKSGVPLILIGVSFACLQFALPRTRSQMLLGLSVGAAFILWGSEQFLDAPAVIAFVDDVVMFLFVLDLGLVIRGLLKEKGAR